jgi:pyruvate formate lyase activating enzyme
VKKIDYNKGLIFSIIRGSFVDGHGLRTTVFLKGCPLRCVWCCNPEGQHNYPELKVEPLLCNICQRCLRVCPTHAIRLNPHLEDDKVHVDRQLCINCEKCVEVCYTKALDYFGKYMTTDELFAVIERDKDYYRSSGGGVTFGGGEPTFQASFVYSMMKKCREHYMHVALDTCGYTINTLGFTLLKEADLLLYDIKGMDPAEHLKNTGVSNELILTNLKKCDEMGKAIIIRVPIVPGYNDSEYNLNSTAEFLSKLKSVERVDLLPYHEYGKVKYKQLGREYECNSYPASIEQMKSVKSLFEKYGLNVQIGG